MIKKIVQLAMMTVVLLTSAHAQPATAQNNQLIAKYEKYNPLTLFAGTQMTSRAISSTYDDTSRGFTSRGFADIFVGLVSSTNDSGTVYFSYQTSDGTDWNGLGFTLFDSLSVTALHAHKYVQLPAKCRGARMTRVRVYGGAAGATGYSANPSTKLTVEIIKCLFSEDKPR